MQAAPAAEALPGCTIGDLPAALLGKIFVLAGGVAEIGPTVTLVSHAWHDAFYAEPSLWSRFELSLAGLRWSSPPWLAAQFALLRRTMPMLADLELQEVDELQAELERRHSPLSICEIFDCVCPAALQRLTLNTWSSMPPGLLARFSNLCSLSLWRCSCDRQGRWAPAVLDAVCSMRQLTTLSATAVQLPPNLLVALADRLPNLQQMFIHSERPLLHAGQLTRLTAVREIHLYAEQLDEPPAPAQLPGLHSLGLSQLPGRPGWQFPGALTDNFVYNNKLEPDEPHGAVVSVLDISQLTCLQALLEAVAPPTGGPIRRLSLCGQLGVPPAAAHLPAGCAAAQQLAALRELRLDLWPSNPSTSIAALAQALLACTGTQLTSLELSGGFGALLPACVLQLRGLRQLRLLHSQLTQLPSGPYLEGLEQLALVCSLVAALPPALPTSLTSLMLWGNPSLVLGHADVDRLLALPRLAELRVSFTATPPAVLERLKQAPWIPLL